MPKMPGFDEELYEAAYWASFFYGMFANDFPHAESMWEKMVHLVATYPWDKNERRNQTPVFPRMDRQSAAGRCSP